MKTTSYITLTTGLALVGLAMAACEGPVGPGGPEGADGAAGADGNANVYSTGWEVIEADAWRSGVGVGSVLFAAYGDVACCFFNELVTFGGLGITDSDEAEVHGAVLAYVGIADNEGNVRSAHAIPVTKSVSGGGGTGGIEFRMAYSSGGGTRWIVIAAALMGGSWNEDFIRDAYLPGLRFRVVVIPPEAAATAAGHDYSDYEAVAEYYGIPD